MAITTNVPYGFELDAMPLEAFGGVGGFRLKPIPGSLQLHGGGARKIIAPVVAIAAAVAIPFAAPAVVAAVGASSAVSAALVGAATGAAIGAAGGAASAAIAGGNVGQGALLGGAGGAIGGGIAGYAAAPAATTATTTAATQAPLGTVASATPTAATTAPTVTTPTAGVGLGGSNIASSTQIAGQVAGGAAPSGASFLTTAGTSAPGSLGATLSGAGGYIPGTAPMVAAGTGVGGSTIPTVSQLGQQAAVGAATTGGGVAGTAIPSISAVAPSTPVFLSPTTPTGLGPTLGAAQTGKLATVPVAGAPSGQPSWASKFGTSLANRVTSPEGAADIVLRAAGQLAGSSLAGTGLTEDQQQLVDMQMAELQQLQQTNRDAFNQRLEAATALLGEARYFDPEYFGLQRARQQQIAGARAKEAGLRGLTGEARRAEERRYNLATARDVGTAYDQGFLTGTQGRLQTQQAGLSALPVPSAYTTPFSSAFDMAAAGEVQRARAAEATGQLFGGLFGRQSAQSLG